MDKALTAARLRGINARIRVWYVEDEERTSYVGTATSFVPGHGLSVWFDGLRASEQEWIDADDEWEWVTEPPAPGGESLALSAVRLRLRGPTVAETMSVRVRGLGVEGGEGGGGPGVTQVRPSGVSPRSFNKKARFLSALSSGAEAPAGGPASSVVPSAAPAAPKASGAAAQGRSRGSSSSSAATAAATVESAAAPPARGSKRRAAAEPPPAEARPAPPARVSGRAAAAAAAATAPPPAPSMPAPQAAAVSMPVVAAPQSAGRLRVSAAGVVLLLPAEHAEREIGRMRQQAIPYPPEAHAKYGTCELSGLPAVYRDPLTGQRYGSLAAFKKLREQHDAQPSELSEVQPEPQVKHEGANEGAPPLTSSDGEANGTLCAGVASRSIQSDEALAATTTDA